MFETFTPGRPMPPGLDVLTAAAASEQFEQNYARTSQNQESIYTTLFPKAHGARARVRAGRRHCSSPAPIRPAAAASFPAIANQRQVELLVEAGFTPLEAIAIGTLNGAKYLGRDARVGTIAVGKQADLVVINGDPVDDHRRRAQGRDRVQAGRRLRSGEVDRVGQGEGGAVVAEVAPKPACA